MSDLRGGDIPFNPEKFLASDKAKHTAEVFHVISATPEGPREAIPVCWEKISLVLSGFKLEPEAVTQAIGCKPDRSRAGLSAGPGTLRPGVWLISERRDLMDIDREQAIRRLLERVGGWQGSFLTLPGVQSATLTGYSYPTGHASLVLLSAELMGILSGRGLSISFTLMHEEAGPEL